MSEFPVIEFLSTSIITYILYFIVDKIIYFSPYVSRIFRMYSALPSVRNWDSPVRRIFFREIFHIIETFVIVFCFISVYLAIPPASGAFVGLMKGLVFALFLCIVQIGRNVFYIILRTGYPIRLAITELVVGVITRFVIGITCGLLYYPPFLG